MSVVGLEARTQAANSHQRIKDLLHQAVLLPPSERLQFLGRSTGGDPELMAELESTPVADPADEIDARQRLERVCRELEAISPRACATLIMYRCEGLTLQEIGDRLGVSRPMARKYLLRAIAYCDQHLEDLE